MPSNLELKRSLEQARKEIILKTKTIDELNEKLSKFLESEESSKVNTIESPLKSQLESSLGNPNVEEQNINTVDSEITPVSTNAVNNIDEKHIKLKKKKRSLWNLYLW